MSATLRVRFRVDFAGGRSLGIGKIELLEAIAATGSLSEGARRMRMSYRRAWLLLADLNSSFDRPVAVASTGGRGGGGARLTDFGRRLIAAYRALEAKLPALAGKYLHDIEARATATAARRPKKVPVASIKAPTSGKLNRTRPARSQ